MWNAVGNISAIVTLFLFVLYIVGHIWKIINSKNSLEEKFSLEDNENDLEASEYFVDFANGIGRCFSVASSNGIRFVRFYEIVYGETCSNAKRGKILKEFKNVGCDEKVYAKINIGDAIPYIGVEIEKNDYVKISFEILDNGKDGSLFKENYKCSLNFKSFVYYLCS